jgi:predicted transcriptional regulator
MVAAIYAAVRSAMAKQIAKQIGLGQTRRDAGGKNASAVESKRRRGRPRKASAGAP